jgi:predicted nucleic acid-binding protein
MPANMFLDSNVCLYILDKQNPKFARAKELLESRPKISTQVIVENINVCIRKFNLEKDFTLDHAKSLQKACQVLSITNETVSIAMKIFNRYSYRIFDSMIVASALEAKCEILY